MSDHKYIIALDQGTTSSRSIVFDHNGRIINTVQQEFKQHYPQPGWVEHEANDIWESQKKVLLDNIKDLKAEEIAAIGITNQRETTIVWDRITGEPIHRAIVWQDRRTSSYCSALTSDGKAELIRSKTGLILDAYFSATKVKYILDHVDNARERAIKGELCFGTVDSWIIFKLTDGIAHVTDATNAARTMLYNIHNLCWDEELLTLFDIPKEMLPEVKDSSEVVGHTSVSVLGHKIPIAGIAGDQHAALFGQMCIEKGMMKNTYGTGCFMMLNTGDTVVESKNRLLSTIAWRINGKTTYALEGSIFVAGAAIQWLRDGLELFDDAKESEELANSVEDNGDVYFVPALTGLGAPHWDQYARGTIVGITRGTTKAHITRAALESISFQVNDVINAMAKDIDCRPHELRVDGGATANNLLMQLQSDISDIEVVRPEIMETTALGAAYLAGLAVGFWSDINELQDQWKENRRFKKQIDSNVRNHMNNQWQRAVKRSKSWAHNE